MIGISIANSLGSRFSSGGAVIAPVAIAATGIGETSFTANWNAFAGAQYYLLDVSTSPSFSSFVLQDEVVIAPTTSYVVIGLTANTTYYYRLRASTDAYIDPDALAFFSRVTTAGGSLTLTEQQAVNTLVLDMKSAGIWSAMRAVYPMVGASAAACAQNLKSSSFTGTFTSGWTFASTGATPNGTSAYMSTGFVVNTEQASANNFSLGVYSGTIGGSAGTKCSLGAYNGSIETIITIRFIGNIAYLVIGETTYNDGFTNNDTHGFYVANRNTTNRAQAWKNGVKIVDVANTPGGKQTNQLYLGAENGPTTPISYDDKRNQFAFMGDGLTDTQASNFDTAVQAFQTTLGRQIAP